MHIEQTHWKKEGGWHPLVPGSTGITPDLVLVFGSTSLLREGETLRAITEAYPHAVVTGCSTAGQIMATRVLDDVIVCTAIAFDQTCCRLECIGVDSPDESFTRGMTLAGRFNQDQLRHVLIFSDGLHINGTNLVKGMQTVFPDAISITGGLAADGELFQQTVVVAHGLPQERMVVAVGFYGDALRIGFGTFGGWDPFGPERLITRSSGNLLYELDGVFALDLYRQYLGEYAARLPASALLFPLAIRADAHSPERVRTVLGVDEHEKSMTFAGDMPEGHYARFMKCNLDRLIDGAAQAAHATAASLPGMRSELALLISCVGRKMVLRQRVEEEVEGVRDILAPGATLAGFYSYGEISPLQPNARCELLNQTMTITSFSETPTT